MDNKQFLLLIDRLVKSFALQANQIRTLQSLLMERGVKPEEFSEFQSLHMKKYFDRDMQFFRRNLLGQFSSQKRTPEEEQHLLDEWWRLDQEPPPPQGESAGPRR